MALKQIEVSSLRLGMFLHELRGAWLDVPFWRTSFLLEDPEDIRQILGSGIRYAVIDIAKGLDVESAPLPAADPVAVPLADAAPVAALPAKVSFESEREKAALLCASAKRAVTAMFAQARMGKAIDTEEAVSLVEDISQSLLRNSDALIGLVRLKSKDDYTYMHSVAVCALMIALARELRLAESEVRQAGLAGLLHDIGKMAVPLTILNKPGSLTQDEFKVIQSHPVAGHRMLVHSDQIDPLVLDVCLHHHEKMDGTGYPDRLAGEQISLFARMGAVCDVYDALTSDRAYKLGWCPSQAILKMAEWKGHFDPRIYQAFVKSVGIYPTGSLVRLESGRLALVVEQSDKSLLMPLVKVFFSTKSMTYLPAEILDLSKMAVPDKIAGREEASRWGIERLPAV